MKAQSSAGVPARGGKVPRALLLTALCLFSAAGCGEVATLPESAGFGPKPILPAPHPTFIPTLNIAPAKGWPAGATPLAAAGWSVRAYAIGLDRTAMRWDDR